ncbi:NlpC/P60 family protein [Rhodococcus sp. NPDC058514]|uniref:C40 family peptidase n=1 Tax=unclassified Rhodococcus (in: high G+C Gram-positive bacteria) TaxID=192944 RepID=UPI00365DDAE0
MPVDPSAVIVAIATALGGLVQGADIPLPVKDQAAQAIQSLESSAPAASQQIDDIIGMLPEQVQDQAQQAVTDAAAAMEDSLQPYLPPAPQVAPVAPPPALAAPPAPEPPRYSAPPALQAAPIGGDPSRMLPGAASTDLPELVMAPIGAIAVFVPWLKKAGEICEGIKPPVLAALYSAENGFRYGPTAPVSRDGARGPGQFMPGTWAKYGKDADGDGKVDILGVADSVMASGHLLCDMYTEIEGWQKQGLVKGDTLDLAIAGYNAGVGAVRRSGGMPSGLPDYENQTKPYVKKIRATEARFAGILTPFVGNFGEGVGGKIVEAALRYLGLPYVWGGGNINGPSGGGFDCSGLTSYALYTATGDLVKLPRTSETQWHVGEEIPLAEARPGDLLFGNWEGGQGGPGHVAIYMGNGQMVHAPQTGDVVRVGPVFDGMKVRRMV